MRVWLHPLWVLLGLLLLAAPAGAQEEGAGDKKDKEDVEILKVTEDGIVFKDEDGSEVQIGDFEQISLDQLLTEPVVTTGGKREQTASASLSTISVLTRNEMRLLPYFYLGEMLAVLPGMDVRWGKMQRLYVGVRGLGGTALNSRTLLLWNGLPHNDPFTGELLGGHFMPVGDIERLEVIRGPGSTLYGANAFSGVVNVITSQKEDYQDVEIAALTGSNSTVRALGGANRKIGPVAVGGSLEFLRTDGVFPTVERFAEGQVVSSRNDDVRSVSVGAHAQYKGLRLEGRFVDGERGMPGSLTTDSSGNILACDTCHSKGAPFGQGIKYPSTQNSCGNCHFQPDDREYVRRGSVALRFDQALPMNFRVSANAYHNEWRTSFKIFPTSRFLKAPEVEALDSNRRTSGFEANGSHAWKRGDQILNSVVLGGEFRRYEAASQVMVSPDGNTVSEIEGAVYAEDEFRPLSWLALTAGARYDQSSLFGGSFSPRGGLVLTPIERLALKGSVGRAFRNPSLAELYVIDRRGRYAVAGNPTLQPEWITSIEGGAYYTLVKPLGIRMGGSFFYNLSQDLIGFRATGPDTASFFNLKEAKVVGFEAEVEMELKKQDPDIKLLVNYSFQRATDEQDLQLPYAPESKFNAALFARYGRMGAMARVRFVGGQMDDMGVMLPYHTTLDMSLSADVWGGLNMGLWATNLTGSGHQESLGIPSAGRSFFFTVGFKR